ncbi:MAG: phosphopyruvate hydratase, partial [Methanobacteriota archaeon]
MSGVITDIIGRMILDSRGNPTIEVDCYVDGVLRGRAGVPSGASTGSHEAVELRDGGPIWAGKGVDTAVANTNGAIRNLLVGLNVNDQEALDTAMVALDGTKNKGNLGANAMLGASVACLRAAAEVAGEPLWAHIANGEKTTLPVPM